MDFKPMTAEEYRALDADAFEQRRQLVIQASEDGEAMSTEQLRSEAAIIKDEVERRKASAELRELRAAAVASGAGSAVGAQAALKTRSEQVEVEDPKNSVEYRTAFMNYVMRGEKSDALAQYRADANTLTSDVSAVIPPMLVQKILEKAETYGMILPLVTKTSYAAGIEIPVATLKPVATWVAEGKGSDKQKYTATDKLVFTHHKLRCEVSVSMEVSVMALPVFEQKIVETVARAMTVAKEEAIINGTGSGQPKGILAETPAEGQALTIASGKGVSYDTLVQAEAAIPQAYETGAKWFMSKKSFMAFVGMTDTAGQPIARVNYGIGGNAERTLLGREVVLTGDYMPNYSEKPAEDTLFAFIFRPEDYILNSVYDMGISKRQDWDTEDMQTKAVTACDGKVADVNSLVTLTVTKATA
jgi:HK97 family phage major capsid protein